VGEGFARVVTVVAILLTIGSLAVAVSFARRSTRIKIGFDLLRSGVAVGAILVMAALTDVATPVAAIAAAVVSGIGLGYAQGLRLEVTSDQGILRSKRSTIALALWGCGVVITQIAGLASRTDTVQLGQTLAWFSACLGIGLIVGRQGPVEKARQAMAVAGTATLASLIVATLIITTALPAHAADAPRTDAELCSLITGLNIAREESANNGDPRPGARDYDSWLPLTAVDSAVATCVQYGYDNYTGKDADFVVYLFASPQEARAAYEGKIAKTEDWYTDQLDQEAAIDEEYGLSTYRGSNMGTLDHVGHEGFWWQAGDAEVLLIDGPLVVHGQAHGLGLTWGEPLADRYRDIGNLQEILVDPMAATADGLSEVVSAGSAQPAPSTDDAPGDTGNSSSSSAATATPASGTERGEPIEPEDAAAQAIGGLIAAAAIGLISWAEASAEIGQILTGTRNISILDPKTGPTPSPPDADSVKEDPEKKTDAPEEPRVPCLHQQREFRKALSAWLSVQNRISSLENEYALLKNQIENGSESDFLGASFDVAMLAIDLRGGKPPTSGMLRKMLDSAKQNYARSISKQLIQRVAAGQSLDTEAITQQAAIDATGLADVPKGRPTSGAFGTWFNESLTSILAANRTYDYMKFMDTLAEPGAVSDPEVMRLLEKSSHESFMERIGPWVGVVTKYIDFYWKNQDWQAGVERRNELGKILIEIRKQINELEYDLSDATVLLDGWRRDLAKCREEMG
jgi:hypothetical protein